MTRQNLLLAALSVICGLVLIEGFLILWPQYQALAPTASYVFCAGPHRTGQPHELFGYTAVPESAYFEQKSEADGWAVHIYNSDGFRDTFNSGEKHVVVLGDSFTEGTLANNDEIFSYLLDVWNPDISFHNFGVKGYGTRQSLVIYKNMPKKVAHNLVILAYFLGNDLRNNLSGYSGDDGEVLYLPPKAIDRSTAYELLKTLNSMARSIRSYNLVYSAIRPLFGGRVVLSQEQIAEGIKLTEGALRDLSAEARRNKAHVLLVLVPAWNRMNNLDDPKEDEQQSILLRRIADEEDGVYLVDLTDIVSRVGADQFYGIKDKHMSRYGQYLTAKAIHDWINNEWERGPRPGRPAPAYQPPSAPVDPDCALLPKYEERFRGKLAK
jgi:hypothetical protein